jgi:hypothetical protein
MLETVNQHLDGQNRRRIGLLHILGAVVNMSQHNRAVVGRATLRRIRMNDPLDFLLSSLAQRRV